MVIAYATDKRKIANDLADAVLDPDENVRNNAARALGILAMYAAREPSKGIEIPYDSFISMLNSLFWTDRNKASFVIWQLSESRDPKLLRRLRKETLPSLIEMARWKTPGHALPAFAILCRIAGIPEKDIPGLLDSDREKVISIVAGMGK